MNLKSYLTSAEAATRLGVTPANIRLIRSKAFPGAIPLGNTYLIPLAEIEDREREKKAGRIKAGRKPKV